MQFDIDSMLKSYPDIDVSRFTIHKCGLPLATFAYALKSSLSYPILPVVWDPILDIPEGLPIVSARTAGIPELIDDDINGFPAKSGDSSDFATGNWAFI